jgi:OHCU decarboxylase
MTMDEVDRMDLPSFVAAFGWVFEHSPWVAERAWRNRPFGSHAALHTAMAGVVAEATRQEQLDLLRAHPDLGTRARMSAASTSEQSGAGLDSLSRAEFEKLRQLNDAYRQKFGFPFLYAVKGSTKYEILRSLETRLQGEAESELATALAQTYRIAQFRLEDTIHAPIHERQ